MTTSNNTFESLDLPKTIKLGLTTECNHACLFCINPKIRQKQVMTEKVFNQILTEISRLKISNVGLYHMGESTLHPQLVEWHRNIKAESPITKTFLTTNGSNDDQIIDLMLDGLDSLKISLTSYDTASHLKITNANDFDKIVMNLKNFIEIRNKQQLNTQISCASILNVTKFIEQLIKNNQKVETLVSEYFYSTGNIQSINVDFPNERAENTVDYVCESLFKTCYILADGTISLCKYAKPDELVIGNILTDKLDEVWNSDKAKTIREKHVTKSLDVCEKCISVFNY